MENNNRKELKNKEIWYKRWHVMYTFNFLALCFVIFLPFFISGKSFVWDTGGLNTGDGFVQHFTSAVYFGNYFRDIILNLLNNHELVIPMWDLRIGTGYDVLTSLNYYAFGDPLSMFYIFTPEKFTGYMYSFVIFLRLYLSGLFFFIFLF
ncbi:YfhO family protein [Anaerofustis sp. LCP19S3_F7]|uniref:YfhO family protein n=1 Tax=Anaerofustis sp. LCP19S3_F7 TaxID=3440247 RepID=UPI003F90E810